MDSNTSYFKQGGLILIAVALGGFFADYVFNLGLTRILSPHSYGDYKIAYAFASIAGIAVLLGGDRAAPRYLSVWLERNQRGAVAGYLLFFGRIAIATSLVILVVVVVVVGLHLEPLDPERHHALVVAVVAVPLIGIGALLSRTLQSAKHLGMAALPWRVAFPLLKLFLVVGAAWWVGTLHVYTIIVLAIVAILMIGGVQFALILRLKLVGKPDRFAGSDRKEWLWLSMPMMATLLVAMGLRQADLMMLELLGAEHHVGYFAAAATVAHLIMITQMTVVGLIAPLIGPAMDAGSETVRKTYVQGQRLMVCLVVPIMALLACGGSFVLDWFGHGYRTGYPAMLLLLAGYGLWAVSGLSSTFLQYGGRGRQVLWVNICTLVLAVVLNWLLIPRYQMTGAGVATAVAFGFGSVWTLVLYRFHAASLGRPADA